MRRSTWTAPIITSGMTAARSTDAPSQFQCREATADPSCSRSSPKPMIAPSMSPMSSDRYTCPRPTSVSVGEPTLTGFPSMNCVPVPDRSQNSEWKPSRCSA
ncbi:hypothetical protein AQJ64_04165 [Streptomyces griseoruber]|uniref:Uncharacterized protein n=1 Tax=Streptomyces griseoruber TaxID=1943 RepID=A0A101T9E1_9ACTN|nr:hypothetical protein AQJ64_04165 [Streptomyces griseoruber]